MKQIGTRRLFAYWNELRAGRSAPEREDIDPAAIKGILRDTFILEVDPGRKLPLRVAGERMSSLFALELKGVLFPHLFRPEDRDCIGAVVESVLDDPTPAVAGVTAGPAGRAPIDLELLLLPLRHRGRTHARILGALTPATSPAWLGLLEAGPLSIASLRIIREDALRAVEREPSAAPDISTLPLSASPPFPAERPALRVVEGGRGG